MNISDGPSSRVPVQLLVVAMGLGLWLVWPRPWLKTLVASYGAAWLFWNYVRGRAGARAGTVLARGDRAQLAAELMVKGHSLDRM